MSALSDLGPVVRQRGALRAIANEAHQLSLILLDTTSPGGDLVRAERVLEKLRALVGGGGDHLEQGAAGPLDESKGAN